jgi:hypothetical protein
MTAVTYDGPPLPVTGAATHPSQHTHQEIPVYPTLLNTPGLSRFAQAVDRERQAQLAKFGDQKHPDGTGNKSQQDDADRARSWCQDAFGSGYGTWADILAEEVAEAFAERDPAKLRAELLQVAAVCAAWIYDIDTRPHSMICAHCGEPIPTSETGWTWHGPVPEPGQPNYTVPRYHLGREYPECRVAGDDTAERVRL